jgi:hypothetical protein
LANVGHDPSLAQLKDYRSLMIEPDGKLARALPEMNLTSEP